MSLIVVTYAVPSDRPQPSVLSSVKQNLAGVRQTAAWTNAKLAVCSTMPWSASAKRRSVALAQPVSGASK